MKKREFIKKGLLASGGLGLLGATSMLSTVPAHANTSVASFAPEDLVAENFTVPSWTLYKRALHQGLSHSIAESFLIPKERPFNIVASVNGDPASQMGITWFTNAGQTGQYLEYVEGDGNDGFCDPVARVEAEATPVNNVCYNNDRNNDLKDIFGSNEKRSYISHKVLLTKLNANTLYTYRVGKEGHFRIGSFRTAKKDKSEFEFIYITGTQSMNEEYFNYPARTVTAARAAVPNAAFLLCTGDLVESAGSHDNPNNSEWEWEQWFERMHDTWLHLPVVPVQGNHDTSTYNNMFHHFNTDKSFNATLSSDAKTAMEGTVYSFVCGDALFMVINFEDYEKGEPYFEALETWMENQIKLNPNVQWRIVAYHKTVFTGSMTHQNDADGKLVRERMAKVFTRLNIDVALQGHGRVYEVIGVITTTEEDHSGIKIVRYDRVEDAITEQTLIDKDGVIYKDEVRTPGIPRDPDTNYTPNMTGREGGLFNVQHGMLYFLNNSAGKKKYFPRSYSEMESNSDRHMVGGYYNMFSKFGQTGDPTFSRVRVSTNAIQIETYTVDADGKAAIFDTINIVHLEDETPNQNSISALKITGEGNHMVRIEAPDAVVDVSMYAFTGTRVIAQHSNLLDLSGIAAGAYLLNVQTVSGVYSERFIVTA